MPKRPKVDYAAPMLSVDLEAFGYEIWPCEECLPWHLEVVVDATDHVLVREWHAAECPVLLELLGDAETET